MRKQLIDINLFLPYFYPKEQQISTKLNPLLKNVRQSKAVSYRQLQSHISFSEQLQTHNSKEQPVPQHQISSHQSKSQNKESIFFTNKTSEDFGKTSYPTRLTSRKSRNPPLQNLELPQKEQRSPNNQLEELYARSKTSKKTKNNKKYNEIPGTADFVRNVKQSDFQKLNLFANNPENQLDLNEDLYNYMRLKMLTKNPYFTGGKSSKIKKHLVEDINLEQIEKKFFKSTSSNTKYKQFFQQILFRKKQKSFHTSKLNKIMHNTLRLRKKPESTPSQYLNQKIDKNRREFNVSKYSQTVDREDSPCSSRGPSPERSKKMSLKAKFLFRKSPLESKQDTQCLRVKNDDTIEVTGRSSSLMLYKGSRSPKNTKINDSKIYKRKTACLEYT